MPTPTVFTPIGAFIDVVSNISTGFSNISRWVTSTINSIGDLFSDLDFTILYDWLPADIQAVITACIALLLVLALFGILRRVLFFLG